MKTSVFLVIFDWDASLQSGNNPVIGDTITADGVTYTAQDWPAQGDNPENATDGHLVFLLLTPGVWKCVYCNGNYVHAADNFDGRAWLGYECDATQLPSIQQAAVQCSSYTNPVSDGGVGQFTGDPTFAVI